MEHAGHHHLGGLGAFIEQALEPALGALGLSETWSELLLHALLEFLDITLLLLVVVAIVSFIQTYIPYDRMRKKLGALKGLPGYLLSLGLGALSPFCSCSIIPVMMGFLAAGVPLPFCLAFLTAASCMNLTALGAVFAAFPLPFALTYLGCALVISVLAGYLAGRGDTSGLVRMDKLQARHEHHHHDAKNIRHRLVTALCSAGTVYRNVWLFILIGVVLSGAVSAFVSEALLSRLVVGNPLALPMATLVGGALHSDVFSILPLAQILFAFSPAVTLSFLLSAMLFSVAEWALLTQAFRVRLIARYVAVLLAMALLCGLAALPLL